MSSKFYETYSDERANPKQPQTTTRTTYHDTEGDTRYEPGTRYRDEKPEFDLRYAETNLSLKSISHEDNRNHKFYKPVSNRTPVLVVFLVIVGTCILLIQYIINTHPDAKSIPNLERRNEAVALEYIPYVPQKRDTTVSATVSFHATRARRRRQAATDGSTGGIAYSDSISSTELNAVTEGIITSNDGGFSVITVTPTTTPTTEPTTSPATTPTTPPGQPNPDSQLDLGKTTSTADVTGQPNVISQLDISSSSETHITVGEPYSRSQLDLGADTTIDSGHGQTTSHNNQAGGGETSRTTSIPIIAPSQTPTSQLDLGGGANTKSNSASASTSNIIPPSQAASIVSGSIVVSGTATLGTVNAASAGAVASGSQTQRTSAGGYASAGSYTFTGGHTSAGGLGALTLTNQNGQATATVFFTGAVVLTDSKGSVTATVSYTAPSTTKSTFASDAAGVAATSQSNSKDWTEGDYFVAQYLPNIIIVALQAAWLGVFATFKLMEPFYQLAAPEGAWAESSLTADYLSAGLSLTFIKAAIDGHWVMLLAGLVQFCLAATVTLITNAFDVVPTSFCSTVVSDRQPCNPKWVYYLPFARAAQVLLIGCFSLILMILVFNLRRVSGVFTDPSRIATVADVLVHKPMIDELRDIPASATKAEIEHDLKDNRYMLGTFIANGREQYGLIKIQTYKDSLAREPYMTTLFRRVDFWWEGVINSTENAAPYLQDFVCMALMLILFGLVFGYRFTSDREAGINKLMNKRDTAAGSVILSILGVCIGFLVKHKERTYRLSHPYVLMSKGPQPASNCVTVGTHATQYSALVKSIYTRDVSLALLSFATILCDIMLLLLPAIPESASQTRKAYEASTYGVPAILAIVLLVHIRITFKQWRRGHHIESPDTLTAVLMRLCASNFVEEKNLDATHSTSRDFEFVQDYARKQNERYSGLNNEKRYRFGCMQGTDGIQRYMVEEDVWPRKRPGIPRDGGRSD